VSPHPWRTDNGKPQLRASGLQKGELLELLPALPLGLLPPLLGISRRILQATGVLLGHLSRPAHLHKLTLKKGDLLDKAFCLLMSRG
jgi:hypothetical protein